MNRASYLVGTVIALLLLQGCSTSAPKQSGAVTEYQTTSYSLDSISQLQARAQNSRSPQREQLLLEVARQLIAIDEYNAAEQSLSNIDTLILTNEHFINYTLIHSELALENDAYFLAKRILTNPRLEQQWQGLSPSTEITLRQRRADIYLLLGELSQSILERLQLLNVLSDRFAINLNQDILWQTLMSMPVSELKNNIRGQEHTQINGWYSLALLSKDNQSNLEKQQALINDWAMQWPEHPASMRLPNDLQLLQELINELPQQVAIILPEQGKLANAATAIRNGFMAAYYQSIAEGIHTPTLRFYDSSEDFMGQYQQAIADGAQMIIGPLAKSNVSLLAEYEALPVPTLAVNYDDDNIEPAQKLYQFGLSSEDEARQVAQRAWVEGHRYAMIIHSEGSWGARSAAAFRDTWQKFGGNIVNQSAYSGKGDYSSVIKQALHIDRSQQRSRTVQNLLGITMESEPRRRQDLDMIFLAAKPSQARQIKPTLAFHYAGKLPVYATSHIYNGEEAPKNDRDLNGVKFVTLPWYFSSNSSKKVINEVVNPVSSYQRLYALGVDGFKIYPRIKQLELVSQTRLYGMTGALSLNQQRQIKRELTWAQISAGKVRELPKTVLQ